MQIEACVCKLPVVRKLEMADWLTVKRIPGHNSCYGNTISYINEEHKKDNSIFETLEVTSSDLNDDSESLDYLLKN